MRKVISILIAAIALVGILFFLKNVFPKYTVFLPYILILLFAGRLPLVFRKKQIFFQ